MRLPGPTGRVKEARKRLPAFLLLCKGAALTTTGLGIAYLVFIRSKKRWEAKLLEWVVGSRVFCAPG